MTLTDLQTSTLFHSFPSPDLDAPTALPFLSQADHPVTARPAWFLHPCETEGVVAELMSARDGEQSEDEEGTDEATRWFECWLAVVASAVDLRG